MSINIYSRRSHSAQPDWVREKHLWVSSFLYSMLCARGSVPVGRLSNLLYQGSVQRSNHLPPSQTTDLTLGASRVGQAKDRVADRKRNLTAEPFLVWSEQLSVVPEQWLLPLGWILLGSMQSGSRVVKGRIRCVVGSSAARCWVCS